MYIQEHNILRYVTTIHFFIQYASVMDKTQLNVHRRSTKIVHIVKHYLFYKNLSHLPDMHTLIYTCWFIFPLNAYVVKTRLWPQK